MSEPHNHLHFIFEYKKNKLGDEKELEREVKERNKREKDREWLITTELLCSDQYFEANTFQTEDLDAYDFDCDDVSNAKAVLMANLSSYGLGVISEAAVQANNLYAQQDSMILSVIEQIVISSQHATCPVIDDEETLILEEDSLSNNQNALEIPKYFENNDLKAQLQAKDTTISSLQRELRRLKGKHVLDNASTIALGMFKLDIKPLSHGLKNNRDAHEEYLKKTIENTDTIRGLVERARKPNPSEPLLDSACKFTKHVQELLVSVSHTCPCFTKPSEKFGSCHTYEQSQES
ncbi:hypothetical protein Tco_0878888 [Tanacetum coccineum]|uniref:Uncharacterized protein n=1 Tax=Tanacetum coccineum TaxID=301880 RepID=A0ABQ5C1G0_9ASTR